MATILSLGLSSPATATPPDKIDVRDDLFGIGPTHVFFLRTTFDNLGLHITGRNDVLLVATEIVTGSETIWPVYRAYRGPDYAADETGLADEIKIEPWDGARNPYDILAEFSGVPAVATYPWWFNDQPELSLTREALTVAYSDGAAYRLETEALFAGLTATRERLADAIGEYDRMAPVTNRDLLTDTHFDVGSCAATDPIRRAATTNGMPVQLVRVTCEVEDGMISSSHYVIVPPGPEAG